MILIFLLHITSIFAKDRNSPDKEGRNLLEISDKTQHFILYGQPRFNTSCDLESSVAAYECEDRVLLFLIRNFSCKNLNTIKYFLSKLMFTSPVF